MSNNMKTILQLFAGMGLAWGSKWTAHLSDEDNSSRALKLWASKLRDLSDLQIFNTLDALVCSEKFPPSIAQFRETALGIVNDVAAFELAKNPKHELHKMLSSWSWRSCSEAVALQKFKAKYALHTAALLTRCNHYEFVGDVLTQKNTNLLEDWSHDL